MFHNRKQQNTEEEPTHYYRNVASYRSYEEVVASKRRRSRFRRGFTALALVLAVGSMGAYWLLGDELAPAEGERSSGGEDGQAAGSMASVLQNGEQDQSGAGEDFAMEIESKPSEEDSGAVVVKDVSDIVEKVRPSVVGVVTESFQNYSTSSTGSGIILSEDGYIVTNNHVIEGGGNISVTLEEGETSMRLSSSAQMPRRTLPC